MGRDYARELRQRGIPLPRLGKGAGWRIWYVWQELDARQRAAFCRRVGLMPIPAVRVHPAGRGSTPG
jgi:hypothetical protein